MYDIRFHNLSHFFILQNSILKNQHLEAHFCETYISMLSYNVLHILHILHIMYLSCKLMVTDKITLRKPAELSVASPAYGLMRQLL